MIIKATENFKVLARKANEPGSRLEWREIKSIEMGDKVMCASAKTADLVTVTRVIPGADSKQPVKVIGKTNA